MNRISKLHFICAGVFFFLFLLTGICMLVSFPELYQGREEVRMMFRATHIYILMSVLVNLMTGHYLKARSVETIGKAHWWASFLILITPALFVLAFAIEPISYLIDRPISFWAVIILFSGVVIHTLLETKLIKSRIGQY